MELPRSFYRRDTGEVARDLLGAVLARREESGTLKGRIVETEAYYGSEDPASRASGKRTEINKFMWGKAGLAMVYMVHGNWLFNVTAEEKGVPGAVLIRAVEPLEGLELMRKRRDREELRDLTSGPGKLTEAFGISNDYHGTDLISSERISISKPGEGRVARDVETSHRIGVREDLEEELRFFISESDCVS